MQQMPRKHIITGRQAYTALYILEVEHISITRFNIHFISHTRTPKHLSITHYQILEYTIHEIYTHHSLEIAFDIFIIATPANIPLSIHFS